MFSSLSSTTKTRLPRRSIGSAVFGCAAAFCASWSISNVKTTSMVVPTFSWLSSVMVPPIISTMSFTMESPRPDPVKLVVVSFPSWENGSKACFWNSSLMPRPLSLQMKRKVAVSLSLAISVALRNTSPPTRLYLMPLLARFIRMRFRCTALPMRLRCSRLLLSTPPVTFTPFSVAVVSTTESDFSSSSPRLNGLFSSSSAPDSSLLISRTLFTKSSR